MNIAKYPRVRLCNLPTPLHEMPNLSRKLGGPRLFIKRDDLTGVAFGGNKSRKLEFFMGQAKAEGADIIVSGSGPQSNYSSQLVASACRIGLKTVLVNWAAEGYKPTEWDGNILLQHMMDAEIYFETRDKQKMAIEKKATELKEKGRKPYVPPVGGEGPLGAISYVNAMLEILNQANAMDLNFDYVVECFGSGSTYAGLVVGAKAFNMNTKVLGIINNQHSTKSECVERALQYARSTAKLLDVDVSIDRGDIEIYDDFVGEGYGVAEKSIVEALTLPAQTEGIFVCAAYTGKAMMGLIGLIRRGYFKKSDNVCFLHSGGTAALFPYREPIKAIMENREPSWTRPAWLY
jgi:L-cysteate sulfo-lyase